MSLDMATFFENKARQWSQGTNSPRFASDFILCVNRAVFELNNELHLSTAIDDISSTSDSISQFDAEDEAVLSAGFDRFYIDIGVGVERVDRAATLTAWESAKGDYQLKIVNALMDDGEEDVALLGYLE